MEYSKQIRSPQDTLEYAVNIGENKIKGSAWNLFLKGIMGGWFAGLGGHAAMVLASTYYPSGGNGLLGPSKLAFGLIFTTALTAIVYTGTDLYTGNTMIFTITFLKKRAKILPLLFKILISLLGNYTGAVLAALTLTGGTGYFLQGFGPGHEYAVAVGKAKTTLNFARMLCSAIGCNCYVCMAIWCSYASLDSSGSIIAITTLINAFAVAGFDHIVANFYTLHAVWISNTGITLVDIYVWNFLPTLIGNTIAGSLLLGVPLFLLYGGVGKSKQTLDHELNTHLLIS